MPPRVVAMIHVPDVRATVEWYGKIGFVVQSTNECDGVLDWASMTYADSEVMFTDGGQPSAAARREVDLYIHVPDVTALHARLCEAVDVVEGVHDTFYGAREFIIRDNNGFWVVFGQPQAP